MDPLMISWLFDKLSSIDSDHASIKQIGQTDQYSIFLNINRPHLYDEYTENEMTY